MFIEMYREDGMSEEEIAARMKKMSMCFLPEPTEPFSDEEDHLNYLAWTKCKS
jgi:hypothetical protein